jgi:nucleoside-diphosphate-sugar epimerase
VPRPDDRVNLIHQTDAAECIARLALMGPSSRETAHVYNAVARSHPTRRDFYTQASRMLGLKPPEFAATDHFNPNSHPRVIDGEKLRRTLGYEFEHDDLLASLGEPLQ